VVPPTFRARKRTRDTVAVPPCGDHKDASRNDYQIYGKYGETRGGYNPHRDYQAANRSLYEIPAMLRKGIFFGARHTCQNRGKIGEMRGNKNTREFLPGNYFPELFFFRRW
jgi:hypothetical protein